MTSLLVHGAGYVVTATGAARGPLRSWADLGGGKLDVAVESSESGWICTWVGAPDAADRPACDETVDLGGRLLTPGFIDCHTHAVFAGDRSEEFAERLNGRTYAEIAAAGGGILHTVAQTRAAPLHALVAATLPRLEQMAAWGVRVLEIKTGYGLDLASELKSLDAIADLQRHFGPQLHLLATAMPAHAIAPELRDQPERYVRDMCEKILPAMAGHPQKPRFCDVFIDRGFFDVPQAERIWKHAKMLGMRLKAHVDELADIGGLPWAIQNGAVSVEHLLHTDAAGIALLAASGTVAVALPLTSVFLQEPLAPLRALVDAGALVAVGTDCNPGSAMTTNLPLAMQMAVLLGKLTPQEALRAVTRNAALALAEPRGLTGRIAPGEPFLPSLFDWTHPAQLFYEFGAPPRALRMLELALLPAKVA